MIYLPEAERLSPSSEIFYIYIEKYIFEKGNKKCKIYKQKL